MANRPGQGRKAFVPSAEQRLTVRVMAACGMAEPEIAARIINPQTGKNIDDKTLRRRFREDLDNGHDTANAMVTQALFKRATSGGPQSVLAQIFWLKNKRPDIWSDKHRLEHAGVEGQPLQVVPDAQFLAQMRADRDARLV